jgi:predicted DNA-binding transcriptional regulator AlpA
MVRNRNGDHDMMPSTRAALTAILRTDPSITPETRAAIVAAFSGKTAPDPMAAVAARILRRAEVAKRCAVTPRSVDNWSKAGLLPKIVLPGHCRASGFRESDVVALIEGKSAGVENR